MPLEQKLKLLLDIDRICDEAKDERSLALQLVAHLAEVVEADLIAFSLPDEHHPGTWKLQAVSLKVLIKKRFPCLHMTG